MRDISSIEEFETTFYDTFVKALDNDVFDDFTALGLLLMRAELSKLEGEFLGMLSVYAERDCDEETIQEMKDLTESIKSQTETLISTISSKMEEFNLM